MGSKADSQVLPTKEASLFRQVVKFYETKQYKKALKAADAVLKKYPEHGETLSMKGLILNSQDPARKEEAYELARRGIKHNLKSHVTWHVYGLLYRADQNYDEAIKCYKNALRIERDNYQILRDLSHLQVQMRDIGGFVETRKEMLALKPGQKGHWISFAVAHHLNGDHALAAQALKTYQGMQEEVPASEAYEHSEMLLYRALILEEGGQLEEALAYLQESKEQLKDRAGTLEQTGQLLLALPGRGAEAEDVYRKLLALNPNNHRYHEGLQAALGLAPDQAGARTPQQRERLSQVYIELAQQYPKAGAVRRLPLDFKVDAEFEDAAEAYVRPFLLRGIPSLFSDLKTLYRHPEKRDALGALMQRLADALARSGALPPPQNADPGAKPELAPQALQWALFYLAQHHDRLGDTGAALAALDRCFGVAPKLPELYSVQARVLKHAGDPAGAAAAAVKAQSLDLADRYLNSAAAKALFRAGRIAEAEAMAALFTRHGDQVSSLTEMQCMWYETEAGAAHAALRQYGKALKMLLAVVRHFGDFAEDQFDFHSYCVRKMTLRAYVAMLRMQDELRGNAFFAKAASGAVQVYLDLDRKPAASASNAGENDAATAALSPEELKKQKQRRRKEQQRRAKEEAAAAREAEAAAAAAKTKSGGAAEAGKKEGGGAEKAAKEKDPDPDGEALAGVAEPLEAAVKLVRQLRQHAGNRLRTHVLAFEVYMRRRKLLLALQAVKRARALEPASPEAHVLLLRFCHAVQPHQQQQQKDTEAAPAPAAAAAQSPVVGEVVSSEVEALLEGKSLADVNEAFLNAHGIASLRHRAAAAEMALLLRPDDRKAAVHILLQRGGLLGGGVPAEAFRHEDAVAVHRLLGEQFGDEDAAAEWKARCAKVFRWSGYFEGADRVHLPYEEDAAEEKAVPDSKVNGIVDAMYGVSLN